MYKIFFLLLRLKGNKRKKTCISSVDSKRFLQKFVIYCIVILKQKFYNKLLVFSLVDGIKFISKKSFFISYSS